MRVWQFIIVVMVLGLATSLWYGNAMLHQTLRDIDADLPFDVRTGDNLRRVLSRMENEGHLDAARTVFWFARLSRRELGIKVGEYSLTPGITASELIDLLVEGRTLLHAMTIVEGWTFNQLRRALASHPALEYTLHGLDEAAIMARLGRPGEHPEGRFFPDTYLFARGGTDLAFLERAMRTMDVKLGQAWTSRDGGLPYDSPYDALIMASIIEREARVASERPTIAGVFVRRLQLGMRLQTDPTVMYGVSPDFTDRLRTVHLRTDTPYNTYTRHGLPPTPIAMPGAGAINAAMHPEPGEALYFVAKGDGSHHFSATLEEHNRAVARYQLGKRE